MAKIKLPEKGTPEWHQLQVAYKTIRMPDAMVGVMGGMNKEEAWEILNKYGFKKATYIFDIDSADQLVEKLKSEIKAPFVNAYKSDLGGKENVSILLTISLTDKSEWKYGILENSQYAKFHILRDGEIEKFSGSMPKMRKSKVKSQEEVVKKINEYFEKVKSGKMEEGGTMANGGFAGEGGYYLIYYKPSKRTLSYKAKPGFIKTKWSERTTIPVILGYELYDENKKLIKTLKQDEAEKMLSEGKISKRQKDGLLIGRKMEEGGEIWTRPLERWSGMDVPKSKFDVGDMVYSWQNKDYPARVAFKRFDMWLPTGQKHENDAWHYKVTLVDKEGYTRSSKWMGEDSLSFEKKDEYESGGKIKNISRTGHAEGLERLRVLMLNQGYLVSSEDVYNIWRAISADQDAGFLYIDSYKDDELIEMINRIINNEYEFEYLKKGGKIDHDELLPFGEWGKKINGVYETGARSHAVNDLILFTDNTRELAEYRDRIYANYIQGNIAPPDAFRPLLQLAQSMYKKEFPSFPAHEHIVDESETWGVHHGKFTKEEANEYMKIYSERFSDWKEENKRHEKGGTTKSDQDVFVYRQSSTTGNYYIYSGIIRNGNLESVYSTGFPSYSTEEKVNNAINNLIAKGYKNYKNAGFQNEDVPLLKHGGELKSTGTIKIIVDAIMESNPNVDRKKYESIVKLDLGKVKNRTWGGMYFLQTLGEKVLHDKNSSVDGSGFLLDNEKVKNAVLEYEESYPVMAEGGLMTFKKPNIKMSDEKYQDMANGILKVIEKNGKEKIGEAYKEKPIRVIWEVFHEWHFQKKNDDNHPSFKQQPDRRVVEYTPGYDVYSGGLNDSHIQSALKSIFNQIYIDKMEKGSTVGNILPDEYYQEFKLKGNRHRKYNIFQSHSSSELRQAVKQIFPSMSKEEHKSLAEKYAKLEKQKQDEYNALVNKAFRETFGREYEVMDYKVSGIVRDEFPDEVKDSLRKLIKEMNEYEAAKTLHEAGVGRVFRTQMADGGSVVAIPTNRLDVAEQSEGERQLELFIDNDGDLYRQRVVPIQKNLMTKIAQGKFDINLAPKIYKYLIDDGEKKFMREVEEHKEYGVPLTKSQKENLAKEYVNWFLNEAEYGNYDNYLPKKYQKEKIYIYEGDEFTENKLIEWVNKWIPFWDKRNIETIDDAIKALGRENVKVKKMAHGGEAGQSFASYYANYGAIITGNAFMAKSKTMASGGVTELNPDDWQNVALRELREHEGDDSIEISDEDIGHDGFEARDGGDQYSWLVFKDSDDAAKYAVERVEEDLEESPESFTEDWLLQHVDEDEYMSVVETDLRSWVEESPESYTSFIDNEDPEEEDGSYSEDQIERMVDGYSEYVKGRLMDWLKVDLGYSGKALFNHLRPYLDLDAAAQDAVDVDGIAHFLARYDGDEINLPSGAVAYKN